MAECVSLAQDASFRSYYRVERPQGSDILMDAPPPREDIAPFLQITFHLENLGLRVPKIHSFDKENGFILMEDLGPHTFTELLLQGTSESMLYRKAMETICRLHNHPEAVAAELDEYDFQTFVDEASLMFDWYFPAVAGERLPAEAKDSYTQAWRAVFEAMPPLQPTMVLRDFHVDNLLLADGECALLDYQDALRGSPAYDVVSLLEDARRDVSPDVIAESLSYYMGKTDGSSTENFMHHYRVWGAQRHAKVLGIFVRLWLRDNKPVYLEHLPRVWALLMNNLDCDALEPVRTWMQQTEFGAVYRHPQGNREELTNNLDIQPL